MRKINFVFMLLMAIITMNAQQKLVDVSFSKTGPVNKGLNGIGMSPYDGTYAKCMYDPIKDIYYGATSQDSRGFYYMMYNADDALGTAFGKAATWEILFRLDNQQAKSYASGSDSGIGTQKIFSSQEDGGWCLSSYSNTGISFQYVTEAGTATLKPGVLIETGKFYHVVVTVENSEEHKANMYVNGQHVVVDQAIPNSPMKFPNIGSTRRTTNMWWMLGGDPQSTTSVARASNSGQCTFVNARIYDAALSETSATALYTSTVKYYTEPAISNYDQLIMDAVFNSTGAVDKSTYGSTSPLVEIGDVNTRYNEEQRRFETVSTGVSANYIRRNYWYDPTITSQMSESYSFEAYVKSASATPSSINSPLSAQQSGGFGFEFSTNGAIKFNANSYGYQTANKACGSGASPCVTPANMLTTDYIHYVLSFDRKAGKSCIYMDGALVVSKNITELDNPVFTFAPHQWFCIGGDTRDSEYLCDYSFNGNISIARVWSKGLTADDAKELYQQAVNPSKTITIDATNKYAGVCLPYNVMIPAGLTAYGAQIQSGTLVRMKKIAGEGEVVAYGTPMLLAGTAGTYTLTPAEILGSTIITPSGNLLSGSFITRNFAEGEAYCLTPEGKFSPAATTLEPGGIFMYNTAGTTTLKTINLSNTKLTTTSESVVLNNVSGYVTCAGEPVEGVKVSDGCVFAVTNADGYYELSSEKKNGYVFIVIPSGYEVDVENSIKSYEKFLVPFWQALTEKTGVAEQHDFKLRVKNNDSHIMIVGTDTHISTTSSQDQYNRMFISALNKEKKDAGSTPIYSTLLGDITCNYHWYTYNFYPETFRDLMVTDKYPLQLFPIMGNHDHDSAADDGYNSSFKSTARYRKYLGPYYYSYNLGKIHYVVLDDTYFLNTHTPGASYSTKVTGDQDYNNYIDQFQLEWLKKDLQYVDKNTPIILGMHIPAHYVNKTTFATGNNLTNGPANSTVLLDEILKDFKEVHILTGHTHYNYHAHPAAYPNIHENNVAAVCAVWWGTEALSGRHNCSDGSPGGYEVYSINGTDIKWQYHSLENNHNSQFHAVDMNPVKKAYQEDQIIKDIAYYCKNNNSFTVTRQDYSTIADNTVLLNVYNYDTNWKIEVTENGKSLTPVRGAYEDPVHYISYDYPRFKASNSISKDSRTGTTAHIFKIQCATATADLNIKVTDCFGNIYTETMHRPQAWTTDIIGNNTITSVNDPVVTFSKATIYATPGAICIDAKETGVAQIVGVDGKAVTRKLSAGLNTFNVSNKGIYIVVANGTSKKLFVK